MKKSRQERITIYIFLFSLTFVFLFLAALYESWSVPFSVLLAVPIGAFGAILTLIFIPSLTDNVYAQIGLDYPDWACCQKCHTDS